MIVGSLQLNVSRLIMKYKPDVIVKLKTMIHSSGILMTSNPQ